MTLYIGRAGANTLDKLYNLKDALKGHYSLRGLNLAMTIFEDGVPSLVISNIECKIKINGGEVSLEYVGPRNDNIRRTVSTYAIGSTGYITEAIVNRIKDINNFVNRSNNVVVTASIVVDSAEEEAYKEVVAKRAKFNESEETRKEVYDKLKSKLSISKAGRIESELVNEYINFITNDGFRVRLHSSTEGVVVKEIEAPLNALSVDSFKVENLKLSVG